MSISIPAFRKHFIVEIEDYGEVEIRAYDAEGAATSAVERYESDDCEYRVGTGEQTKDVTVSDGTLTWRFRVYGYQSMTYCADLMQEAEV